MASAAVRFFVLAVALEGSGGVAQAEPVPAPPAAAFVRAAWTTDDGLPQNSIGAIVQSRDGYLWLGTLGGLVRFDGIKFEVFVPSTHRGLTSSRIRALHLDRQQRLWIGTEDGGLVRYEHGVFTRFESPHVALSTIWF